VGKDLGGKSLQKTVSDDQILPDKPEQQGWFDNEVTELLGRRIRQKYKDRGVDTLRRGSMQGDEISFLDWWRRLGIQDLAGLARGGQSSGKRELWPSN